VDDTNWFDMKIKEIPLQRLLPIEEAESILAAFTGLLPGNTAAIFDMEGRCLAWVGPESRFFESLPDPVLAWLTEAGDYQPYLLEDAACYPLKLDQRCLGCLVTKTPAPAAAALQNSLALLMKNAFEKRSLARETLERYREINLLYHLAERFGASLDEGEILQIVLAEARRVIPAVCGVVLLREAATDPMGMRASFGDRNNTRAVESLLEDLVRQNPMLRSPNILTNLGNPDRALETVLYAPLSIRAGFSGLVAVGRYAGQPEFTAGEMKLLLALAGHAAIAVETAWLHQQELQHQRIEQELLIGQRIQHSLLPKSMPVIPGWELTVRYQAASRVGGDFYDIFALPCEMACLDTQCYGLTIADVTGKGIPAALMMAFTKGILHTAALAQASPAKMLLQANKAILQSSDSGLLLTAFYGVLDPCTGWLRYANAGHEPPIHYQAASGQLSELTGGRSLIMGALEEGLFSEAEIQLQPGDALFFYTDGVTEARNAAGEFYAEERLYAALAGLQNHSGVEVMDTIHQTIDEFSHGVQQSDDITMFLLRWLEEAGADK
jgi:sigma-B regulation protein RsbU (phosphoserine phosphatase)